MSLPALGARPLDAVDRRLDLQRVLAGLDQYRIDLAGDQPRRTAAPAHLRGG